ncbi:MAG: AAA domain-containing protein [Chloroflexota bacterium]
MPDPSTLPGVTFSRGRSVNDPGLTLTPGDAHPAAEVDEGALVHSLEVLRKLIQEQHALEMDRAARVPPLAFETAEPMVGDSSRTYEFRTVSPIGQGDLGAALRVGDTVDVAQPDGSGCVAYGTVVGVLPRAVLVGFSRQPAPGAVPPRGSLRLRADDNQRAVRLGAIERVVRARHALPWIGVVLASAAVVRLSASGWDPPADLALTDAQRRALAGATRSQDIFLIQGPPGTGKTTVIAALLRYFARERGSRVLLSSKGHRAIDNVLERLGLGDLHVVRLGQAAKVTGAGQPVLLAEVLAQAERGVPARHLAARAGLEDLLGSLQSAEHLLGELDSLNRGITRCDAAIAQHEADAQASRAKKPDRIRHAFRTLLHRAGRRRLQPDSEDLVGMRRRAADLHADHLKLTRRADSVLPPGVINVSGVRLPKFLVSTPDQTDASLTAVREARRQVAGALPVLQAWGRLLERPGALADVLLETVEVVAATAVGVNSGRDAARLAELEFDVAIVDEAAQAQLTDLIVPLSRARTVILVGDHQQLPPYVDDELVRRCKDKGIDTTWLEKSVFECLWECAPPTHRTRLDLQFRMPHVIADFLGREFYAGELASSAANQGAVPVCSVFLSPVVLVDTSNEPDRTETVLSPGVLNRCEALLLAEIAARLPPEYLAGEGLGVIAPYAAQVAAARQALADALGLPARDPWLVDNVATVDGFQGQERDVILVSLTRSNADGSVGFLTDLKRLNVTLSRARKQLVIIGDLSTLCAARGGLERRALARFAGDLVEHLRQAGEVLDVGELRRRLARD